MRRGRCWLVLPVFLLLQLHLHSAAAYDEPDRQYPAKKAHSDSYSPPYHGPECEPGFGYKPNAQDRDYYDTEKGTCEPCAPGFYAPGGLAPCRPCGTPNGGFTTPNGAHKPDQCFCKPGTGGVGCLTCPLGTWSTGGTKDEPRADCTLCSNGALSLPGATSAAACGCLPGRGGEACTICPVDTYGPGGVDDEGRPQSCINCTENQQTLYPGAKSAEQCVCKPGFAGPFCQPCSQDQICPGGDKEEPTRCPANSVAPPGDVANFVFSVRDCVCKSGYGRPAHSLAAAECKDCPLCELCPAGTFNDNGTETCKPCPKGNTSPPGSATSDDCTPCGYRFYLEGGICQECPSGSTSEESSVGKESCNTCLQGFGLKPCPGSFQGTCLSCQACPPGTYQNLTLRTAVCKECNPGQTSRSGSTAEEDCKTCLQDSYEENGLCVKCPMGSISGEASGRGRAACNLCIAGYGPQPCPGTKDGSCTSCQPCPAGTYGEGGIGACLPCNPGETSPPGSINDTACTNCSFSEYEENGICLKCPIGNQASDESGRGPAACRVCATGYGAQPGLGSKDGGACQVCPAGTYGLGGTDAPCVPCDPGQTSPPGSTEASKCTNCTEFEYEQNGICVRCPVGSYTAVRGRGPAACNVCNEGFGFQPCPSTKDGSCTSCQPCPAGTFSEGGFNIVCTPCGSGQTSPPGSSAGTDCKNCTVREYEENGICLRCPTGSRSIAGSGSGRAACSQCVPGYSPQPCPGTKDGSCIFCQPCPVGSYKSGTNSNGCKLCNEGTTTLTVAAETSDDCVCKPGFGYDTSVDASPPICKQCPLKQYSNVDTGRQCESCPVGMTTLQPGATSQNECVCEAGYGRDITGLDSGGCDPCGKPFYQGVLDRNLQAVTTATLQNPRPLCQKCPDSTGAGAFMVVGTPDRRCLANVGDQPGAFCSNKDVSPQGLAGTATQRACAT